MTDEQREREMRTSADMATRWRDAPYATRYAEDVPWLLARLDEARRELDALRDAAREDLAFLDAVRRENEELRAELEDARWLIEDLQLDLRELARHVDAGGTE